MSVIRDQDTERAEVFPGVFARQIVHRGRGSAAITMGEVVLQPGATLPRHLHKVEEVIFIVEGNGQVALGDETLEVSPNTTIYAPAGVRHQFTNTGAIPLRLVFAFPAVEVERILC